MCISRTTHIGALLAIVLTSVLALTPAGAQERTIRIAMEGNYPPWNFTRPDGSLDGFEVDLSRDLCSRLKAKCEIAAQEWSSIIPALNAGKFDAIIAGLAITDKRREVIAFSIPYVTNFNGFLVHKDSDAIKMPGTGRRFDLTTNEAEAQKMIDAIKPFLKGKTLGVQGSTTHSAFADKYLRGVVEIREYKTIEQHDLDLAAGRIDILLANAVTLKKSSEKPDLKDLRLAGPNFFGGVIGEGVGVGLRKSDTELRQAFNAKIREALADGTVKRLSLKWFAVDLSPN